MASATTYIVIEVTEKENALDIMNILMTHTKVRFTITKDIVEYATERGRLSGKADKEEKKQSTGDIEIVEPPLKRPAPSPIQVSNHNSPEEVKQVSREPFYGFGTIVPKTEQDLPPPEPYLQDPAFQHQAQKPSNYANSFNARPMGSEGAALSAAYYQSASHGQLANNSNYYWQEGMESSSRSQSDLGKDKKARTSQKLGDHQCAVCGNIIKALGLDYTKRSNHAIVHTMLQRFRCPADKCDYRTRHRSNINSHLKIHHPEIQGSARILDCLTPEEDDELKEMVVKCFPEMTGVEVQKRGPRMKKAWSVQNEEQVETSDHEDDVEEIEED